MNLILIEPTEVTGSDITVTGARARHLREVLKVAPAQPVRVGVIDGPSGRAIVTAISEDGVTLRCAFEEPPSVPPVDLLLALPRPKVMRRLWAQLAALGVGRIIVTNADRVERNYFDTHVLTPECYRPLLVEGLQQARDTRLPRVSIHRQFRRLIEGELDAMEGHASRVVADPSGAAPIRHLLAPAGPRVLLAVGPEGGWNAFELSLLDAHGFRRASMGHRTLRSDTACIALMALVHDAIGPV